MNDNPQGGPPRSIATGHKRSNLHHPQTTIKIYGRKKLGKPTSSCEEHKFPDHGYRRHIRRRTSDGKRKVLSQSPSGVRSSSCYTLCQIKRMGTKIEVHRYRGRRIELLSGRTPCATYAMTALISAYVNGGFALRNFTSRAARMPNPFATRTQCRTTIMRQDDATKQIKARRSHPHTKTNSRLKTKHEPASLQGK
ncbi:unnamed protein product [Linum trigynum]|uniref:Uncharacterized protein n=1 Tax=Linum trigynum TaxID=586398 RepID=A0AAV2FN04_9ROSI